MTTEQRGQGWRDLFRMERPVPPTPASRRLRRLIAITALAVVIIEALNLLSVDEPGFALVVRTLWALLRVLGFLVLMRAVRYGRAAARPFGLILAVTTVFAVVRLTAPRQGSVVPEPSVLVGLAVLTVLCSAIVWLLFRSPAVADHLATRPVRRHIPAWVLTARIAVLAYAALLLVPFLVALSTAFGDERRLDPPVAVAVLVTWLGLFLVVSFTAPFVSFFVVMGKGWARVFIGLISVAVLVLGPALCYLILGLDGLLRDGVPLAVTALVGLFALYKSRGLATWVAAGPGRQV
jgi:hypothetical protein